MGSYFNWAYIYLKIAIYVFYLSKGTPSIHRKQTKMQLALILAQYFLISYYEHPSSTRYFLVHCLFLQLSRRKHFNSFKREACISNVLSILKLHGRYVPGLKSVQASILH